MYYYDNVKFFKEAENMDLMQPILDFLKSFVEKMKSVTSYLLEKFLPEKKDDGGSVSFWGI